MLPDAARGHLKLKYLPLRDLIATAKPAELEPNRRPKARYRS